ncbi:carbohydrate esterase family 16 protein [Macrolepiota fuliginosa MF-IS2]|uniref:Carbohydrate esterase family 16 protein n=1 Tax=Macrolepiota fuliginosa MF-IS2 TaxID=1400762 RepID=A0A9P5XNV2_9AGAR|nr:carbohydrate esterase family 16 protein [Macrolepiota fuliginosa MF-IS2]
MVLGTLVPLLFVSAVSAAVRPKQAFDWDRIEFVYVFGDSYSFVPGTFGLPSFSFIGDKLDLTFTPTELLTNEIVPRNTSSEGSNWLEFLTECFEGSPLNCPRQLWDFAFAGADIDGDLLPLHHNFTIPLVDQVTQWVDYGSDVVPHPPGETLTVWWIGINDTGDTNHNSTITDFASFWETEIQAYFQAVAAASEHGLGTHLFLNVPPEERSPGSLGDPGQLKDHIDLFNGVLASHIDGFAKAHPDNIVMTFDAHAWFNRVLDAHEEFGFTNVTGFCTCAKPSGYFWYNSGHPTERVHQLLAEAVRDQLLGYDEDIHREL